MSLIYLLSLLSAAFLAGLVSSTTEEDWSLDTAFLVDDTFWDAGWDGIFDLKATIDKVQFTLENYMEPSIHLNITGLHYVRGIHNAR